jgi:hypothetical protein
VSEDRGSPWGRLKARLEKRLADVNADIVSGQCDMRQYYNYAGRYAECLQTLTDMEEILRGDDLRRPEEPSDLTEGGLL